MIAAARKFSTFRIRVADSSSVLKLGTLSGAPSFTLEAREACEFGSAMVAAIVAGKLGDQLNATARSLRLPDVCRLEVVAVEHEKPDAWSAMHRFDRTALESAYYLADVLPSWVRG